MISQHVALRATAGIVMLAVVAVSQGPCEAQAGPAKEGRGQLLKVETRRTTREAPSLSVFEGLLVRDETAIWFDSVKSGRGDALTYFRTSASPRSPWRVLRDGSGRFRLVAVDEQLPGPNDERFATQARATFPEADVRDTVAYALEDARLLLEHATMFEGAPPAGTVRRNELNHRWHLLDLRLELSGRWSSTRLRDSVAPDGARYAIVRDESNFDVVAVRPGNRFTEASIVNYRDTIHATSTGTRVVALASGRAVIMSDTTVSNGRHVRRDLDGAELPSRSETHETSVLRWFSEAEFDAWLDEQSENSNHSMRGQPSPPRRQLWNDARLRDSLAGVLATRIPWRQRDEIMKELRDIPDSLVPRRWMDSLALVAGDTAWVVRSFAHNLSDGPDRITAAQWLMLAPYVRDRQLAWRRGVDSWALAGSLIGVLQGGAPAFNVDRESWACDSVTCESIAREYESTRRDAISPRAELGLAMRALLRPVPWADSVLFYAPSAPLLRYLRDEIIGLSYNPPGGDPAPDINASWREWFYWKYSISPNAPVPATGRLGLPSNFFESESFGRGADATLRWHDARTGISSGTLLKARYAAAVSDSERVVFAALLNDIGQLRDSLEQVTRTLSSSNAASRAIARMQINRFKALPAESGTASELHAMVIDIHSGSGRRWPPPIFVDSVAQANARRNAAQSPPATTATAVVADPQPHFLVLDGATPDDSVKVAPAGLTLVPSTFRLPENLTSKETRVTIDQFGPFAWIHFHHGTRTMRANGTHVTTDSGSSLLLLRTSNGWRLVKQSCCWMA